MSTPTERTPPLPQAGTFDVEALAAATPSDRDRAVDFIRALSIAVVVLWHWTFSVTQWSDGAISMPNPIGNTSGLWVATWVLQVMPLFFVVGGYANLAGWDSLRAKQPHPSNSQATRQFVSSRLRRLGRPAAALAITWLVIDVAIQFAAPSTPSVLSWGVVVFVPLWFLATYAVISILTPLTAAFHTRRPASTLASLMATIALGDLARFSFGIGIAGYVTTGAVWLFAHQLGFWWRDGSVVAAGRDTHLALTIAGLVGLVVLSNVGVYPRSTVAVDGEWLSNMFPTTALIAFLAIFQLGLVLLIRPHLSRWLGRSRWAWRGTIAINAVAMTVFCWHMTALVVVLTGWHLAGFDLIEEPTTAWWLQRPFWFIAPAIVLAPLVRLFMPIEHRSRS